MAVSLNDLFPMLRSAKGSADEHAMSRGPWSRAKRKQPANRRAAAPRASAISFETFEPRVLLSADTFAGDVASYLANPQFGTNAITELEDGLDLVKSVTNKVNSTTEFLGLYNTAIPGLLERESTRSGNAITSANEFYAPTLADVLGKIGKGILSKDVSLSQFFDDLFDDLDFAAGGSPDDFADALDGLDIPTDSDGVTIKVNLLDWDGDANNGTFQKYALENVGGDNYQFLFKLEFVITIADASDAASLDLGRNADALEINYGAASTNVSSLLPEIQLLSTYRVATVLGLNATITQDVDDDDNPVTHVEVGQAFLRDPNFAVGVAADQILSPFTILSYGFLDIEADAGTAKIAMAVGAQLTGDFDESGDFSGASVDVAASPDSEIEIEIPVKVEGIPGSSFDFAAGFDATLNPTIRLFADKPFEELFAPVIATPLINFDPEDPRTGLQIELTGFDDFDPFRNIDADGMANVLSGLASMLESLQGKAELFGVKIPFLDGQKISSLLDFDGPVRELYEKYLTKIQNGVRVATFANVQQFVNVLRDALDDILPGTLSIADINPTFTTDRISQIPTLLFNIRLAADPAGTALDVDGDLGASLGPLGNVAVSGSLDVDTKFELEFTLGIELSEDPVVEILSISTPFAMTAVADANTTAAADAEFRLLVGGYGLDSGDAVLGGAGAIDVTLGMPGYADIDALAAALRTAISNALGDAGLPTALIQVGVVGNRLVLSSDALPVLQIVNAGDTTAFNRLGFLNNQAASNSPLPVNGVLSGNAEFELWIGGNKHTISVAPDASNATFSSPGVLDVQASLLELVADVNAAIGATGAVATLVGNQATGYRLRLAGATSVQYIRVDAANPVAERELGLLDDTVSSRIAVRGESGLAVGPNSLANKIADPNLGEFGFDVTLTQGADTVTVPVTVQATDNGASTAQERARNLAADINAAFERTELDAATGQTLSSVLIATAVQFVNGTDQDWGIRISQPLAQLNSTDKYAVADSIEISGIGNAENIGLSNNATAQRTGPTLLNPLAGDAKFTVAITAANGIVTQEEITVAAAGVTTLVGLIDALNTALTAKLGGKVVAGLDGTRIVLAATDPSVAILTLLKLNDVAREDLGFSDGVSARQLSGIDAFLQNVHLLADIQATGSASGSATFGFVGLDLGTATAAFNATVDIDLAIVDENDPATQSEAIFIREIFNALQRPVFVADGPDDGDDLDVNPAGILGLLDGPDAGTNAVRFGPNPAPGAGEEIDIFGSASIRWDGAAISVAGLGGVADDLADELDESASPYIDISIPDLTNLDPESFVFDYDLGGIASTLANQFSNLANFSFDDAIAALRFVADWLKSYVSDLGILNDDLPLLGVSLADTLDFVDDFAKVVEDIAANPTKTLQSLIDSVNEGLQRFVGPLASIAYEANSPGVLTFTLPFKRNFADNLPLRIDMEQLLQDAGVNLDLPGVELSGAADLEAAFGIDAQIKFGIDVSGFSGELDKAVQSLANLHNLVFLDADETYLELTAYAAAENVTFIGSLGPLGLFVTNGGAILNGSGNFGDTTPASIKVSLPTGLGTIGEDGRITLGEFFTQPGQVFNKDNVDFNLHVAGVLPVYFPTSSSYIGNLDFSGFITDPFDPATGVDFTLNSLPDFSNIDFSSFGLLDTLNLFLAGADTVLGTLGGLIDGELFGTEDLTNLPLVGDALGDVGAFIEALRNEVIPGINALIDDAQELAADVFMDIGEVIDSAFQHLDSPVLDFDGSGVTLQLFMDGGDTKEYVIGGAIDPDEFSADVLAAEGFSFLIDLNVVLKIKADDVDLGLDVFALEITDPVDVLIDLGFTFGIGISLDEGFFFQVNPEGESDLSAHVSVSLPDKVKAQLFLLQLEATQKNPGTPNLTGNFSVDVLGTDSLGRLTFGDLGDVDFDVDYSVQTQLDMMLSLGLNEDVVGFGFPTITADFGFAWNFDDDAPEVEAPFLSLGNIALDIGSFLGETIGPFIEDVYEVLEPIDPVLDILTDPIPVVSDLLGPTSLLDLGATFGFVNPALVTALEILDQLVDFAATAGGGVNGSVPILPGTISFGGQGGINLADPNQAGALADPSKALKQTLNEIATALGGDLPDEVTEVIDFISSGFQPDAIPGLSGSNVPGLNSPQGGFSFPFLEDFTQVLGLFFGRNMTLVAYDLPPLEFGFDFSVFVPIWGPLGARFAGGINAIIDLAFGYDTEGFFRFAQNDFRNPLNLVDGFFIYDDNPFGGTAGIDVPELVVTGQITAAAELNAVVASAGVGGGIFATLGFDLVDPDQDLRVRLDEILANLRIGFENDPPVGPLALFTVDALIEAKLFAYIEALFGIWRKDFQFGPSVPLYQETYSVAERPILATDMGDGTLRLNVGKTADERVYTTNGADDPTDVAETIEIEIVDANTIKVRGKGTDFNDSGDFIGWQTYTSDVAWNLILADAGQGNDSIRIVSNPNNIALRAEFKGGAGDDVLEGSAGDDLLDGGTGSDKLTGNGGADTMDGGAGDDCLDGGAGNDHLVGGAGADVIVGGADDDVLLGGDGDDTLAAGAGNDTVRGGRGRDLISGGEGDDILLGDEDADRIWGDADFSIVNCVLVLDASFDEPLLVSPATHGKDYISGGGGSDELLGNGGDDVIYGDSSFQLDADYQLVLENGKPVLLLPAFGDFGADNISGGGGSDTIFGEAGNDVIRGDNTRVINASDDDNDPRTFFEGDRFNRGTAHADPGGDGNDVIDAGKGADIVFGNAGNDTITGGTENDILFGNAGDDTISGALGADVIFGDNGVVAMYVAGDAVQGGTYDAPTQDFKLLRAESEAGDGDDTIDGGLDADIIFGGAGNGLQDSDPDGLLDLDLLDDFKVEDLIRAGSEDDIVFGDHGLIDFTYVKLAGRSYATNIESIDKDVGGDDQIFGSTGRDVLIGGKGNDRVNGDDGYNPDDLDSRDVVAGDHVKMTQVVKLVQINALDPDADLATKTTDVLADVYVAFASTIVSNETAPTQGGNDILDGGQDDDYLIGGPGDDDGTGGRGNDVILGDRGQIDFDLSFVDAEDPNWTYGKSELFVLLTVKSTDLNPVTDIPFTGVDELSGGHGNDVVIGGGRGDFLYGDQELDGSFDPWIGEFPADVRDMLLGDNGQVDYAQHGQVVKVFTTDTVDATGGEDTISGNQGADIALGGVQGDTIYGDNLAKSAGAADGDDVLLGDNGALEWLSTGRLNEISGIDIAANNPDLWAKYGSGAADDDITTLDLVTTQDPSVGGRDTIYGDNGRDMMFGGSDADTMYGDSGTVGNLSANGNDIMFGDHGRVYPQFSRYMVGGTLLASDLIFSRNYFAIDTGNGKRGQGDRMWGEEGDDVMLGQQGDDRMWGGDGNDDMIGGHNVAGGVDELDELASDIDAQLPAVANVNLDTDDMNDLMDGGAGNDAMAGDNAIVWRRGDDLSPRFRALTAETIYSPTDKAIVANVGDGSLATWQSDPADAVGRDIELLDHSDAVQGDPQGRFGQDVMAGGADDDVMFGQLGDDLMQGDGSIGTVGVGAPFISRRIDVTDAGSNPDTDETLYFNIPEIPATDGDDYLEGNGGSDLMYGGLGQDDMIGGSSALFGLTTEALRPDGSDTMFGGAGIDTGRNHIGDATQNTTTKLISNNPDGNGLDADYMMGDNANVYRLVKGDASDAFLRYNYDAGYAIRIIPRAMQQLDYTLGGADYNVGVYTLDGQAQLTGQPADNGAADLIHGESGDDVIFGMTGSDVLFGDGQDDDIVGGYGHDWISGGTGQDGILGDDGLVLTSRNSTAGEPLNGIAGLLASDPEPKYSNGNVLDEYISTPGSIQTAVINKSGELKKTIDLVPFSYDPDWQALDDEFPDNMGDSPFADDIIFGGLGSDWLHGGSGDDAISGAEALDHAYVPVYDANGDAIDVYDLGYAAVGIANALVVNPINTNRGNVLAFNAQDTDGQHLNNRFRAGEFRLYDEYDPRRVILLTAMGELSKDGTDGLGGPAYEFLLNFNKDEGVLRPGGNVPKATGQQTTSYGPVNDDGDDRIFGDLGNDWLVGGTGRDNAYGGWGNDLLNVDDDHTTNGGLNDQPDTHPTYEDRAYGGAGRDVLIGNTGGDRLIDWVGEYNSYLVPYAPFGQASVSRTLQPFLPEFLYALSEGDGADPTRASYTGDPRNGEPNGELGLVLQKDQAWQDQTGAPADPQAGNIPGGKRDVLRSADFSGNQAQGFVPESGSWTVKNGRYEIAPLYSSGTSDAISLFNADAVLPSYFEIAATINAVKPTAGFKANAYVIFDYVSPTNFKFAGVNVSTNKFEIGQRTANGWQVLNSLNVLGRADTDYNVLIAVNGNTVTAVLNGKQSLSYAFTPRQDADGFTYLIRDGMIGLGGDNARARIDNVRVQVIPPAITHAVSDAFDGPASTLLNAALGNWALQGGRYVATPAAGAPFALAGNDLAVGTNAFLQLDSVVRTAAVGGIVFDMYSPTDFKWAAVSVSTQQVLIGHYTAKGGWVVDAAVSRSLSAGTDYALGVSLKGTTVSVTLNGQAALSRVFNSTVVDGAVGTFARGGSASFDSFGFATDDAKFAAAATSGTTSTTTSSKTSATTSTSKLSFDSAKSSVGAQKGWRIDWNAITQKTHGKRAAVEGVAKGRAAAWQQDFVLNLGERQSQRPNEGLRVTL